MKALLEFELPEDMEEFHFATHGVDYYSCLSKIRNYLRNLETYDEASSQEDIIARICEFLPRDLQ